jgi:hypothetical protein
LKLVPAPDSSASPKSESPNSALPNSALPHSALPRSAQPRSEASDSAELSKDRGASPLSPSSSSSSSSLSSSPSAGEEGGSNQRGLPIWLFVVLFLAFALVSGWQFQVAAALEEQIIGLESELVTTTDLLDAHQERLVEIRGGVHALVSQVDGLRALVDADPGSVGDSRPHGAASPPTRAAELDEIPARLPQ